MTKQLNFKFLFSLFVLSFLFLFSSLDAQRAIYGNGNIQEDKRLVANFSKVNISLNGNIIIHTGQQAHVIVKTDENIINMVTTVVRGNTLTIDQKDWPEPSKNFTVHIYAPAITTVMSESWANIKMENIVQDKLNLSLDQGSIVATGNVGNLSVFSEQAKFNLKELTTKNADVTLTGYADMVLCCAEKVKRRIESGATFKLLSDPNQNKNVAKSKEPIEYINFTIVNNRIARSHFVVRGPKNRRFSYGFSLIPYFSKKERWPIGTKVYRETLSGNEILLIEIVKSDENQKINLFKK